MNQKREREDGREKYEKWRKAEWDTVKYREVGRCHFHRERKVHACKLPRIY